MEYVEAPARKREQQNKSPKWRSGSATVEISNHGSFGVFVDPNLQAAKLELGVYGKNTKNSLAGHAHRE